MSEAKKKSGAEKAIDKAEAKARAKVVAAIDAWAPLRKARNAVERAPDGDERVKQASDLAEALR